MNNDICGNSTTVNYGNLIGNVGAESRLTCQRYPNHEGRHEVARWLGHVFMLAKWD